MLTGPVWSFWSRAGENPHLLTKLFEGPSTMQGAMYPKSSQILGASTAAFTVCFAVWTIFSIIGIRVRQELGLTETQFGLLVGTPT